MIRSFRRGAAAAAALFLAAFAPFAAAYQDAGWGPGPVVLKAPKGVWAQSYSDIEPDPAVKFGTLPNGMRYAIMKNATPPNQASLRLWFDAGSIYERDDQQGLAHFLEHMAFNGSKAVPEATEMIRMLERLGLAFGADTNASTGFTETIYKLDLPRTDDETVDTALMLFREAASELLLAPDDIDGERGVVLSEERSRDSPDYRIQKRYLTFLLGDHIVARRMPIGQVEVLRTAGREAIADFYRNYYRPERAVLVAVGDFDVAKMEEKIRAEFGDWTGAGEPGREAPLTLPVRRDPAVEVVVEPGVQLSIGLNWVAPPDLDPDSRAERAEDLAEGLGYAVLNRRLERIARAAEPPFIAAGAYSETAFYSAQITSIDVSARQDGWREALTAAVIEQRRAAQYGVAQAELDREIEAIRTALQARVAAAATRRTPALAEEIVGTLDEAEVLTSPAQDLALFEEAVKTIDAERVSQALKASFEGSGPLVFIATPTPLPGGEEAVREVLAAALAAPVEAPQILEAKAWPYDNFGPPGRVAEERRIEDLGVTFVRYANGVRLTVKPTNFRDEQILVSVRVGSGMLAAPKDVQNPSWTLPIAFMEGGLKDLTAEEIDIILNTEVVGASLDVGEDAVMLSGATRPEDLEVQMQLLAAYITAPGWRPEPLQRMKAFAATIHDQQDQVPGGVFGREIGGLLRPGDKRWTFPSRQEVASVTLDDVRALVDPQLRSGAIEIVIVGDVTVEAAKDAVARTFGALPERSTARPQENPVAFPEPNGTPLVLTHKGRADQAIGFIAWKTDDYFDDIHEARTLRVVGDILRLRLIEELRENQGATYSPQVAMNASAVFDEYGYASVMIEVPPEALDGFFRDVERIVADLRASPPSEDELARAKNPAIESMQRRLQTNELWLSQLSGAQDDPRRLEAARTAVQGIQRVTAADVRAAAAKYLTPDKAWKLVVKPESTQ